MPARSQCPHTKDGTIVKQRCFWPEQKIYELIRLVVLFGDPPAERAQETRTSESTLRRLGSLFLDLLAGYGYRPGRTLLAYLLVILGFTMLYTQFGFINGHPLQFMRGLSSA